MPRGPSQPAGRSEPRVEPAVDASLLSSCTAQNHQPHHLAYLHQTLQGCPSRPVTALQHEQLFPLTSPGEHSEDSHTGRCEREKTYGKLSGLMERAVGDLRGDAVPLVGKITKKHPAC